MESDFPNDDAPEATQPEFSGGALRIATRESVVDAMRADADVNIDNESDSIKGLAAYLWNIWEVNKRHKREEGIQTQMVDNLRARNSDYSESKLASIKEFGGSDIFMGLSGVKCRAAEAWFLDVMASTEKPWAMRTTPDPTPDPSVLPAVLAETQGRIQQMLSTAQEGQGQVSGAKIRELANEVKKEIDEQAKFEIASRTTKMETKIHDQMVEGGWVEAFEDFVSDLVTLKAAIIKGPIARIRRKKRWTWDEGTSKNVLSIEEEAVPEYERVSPFDMYPGPNTVGMNDGSLAERVKFTRRGLVDLKDQPGYDPKAIDEVLAEAVQIAATDVTEDDLENEREDAENRNPDIDHGFSETIPGIEFWCSVQGKMLKEHNIEEDPKGEPLEDLAEYEINAIMIDQKLIYVDFNDDPLGERPYFKTGWAKVPGSFWYQGVPELMDDLQQICNASIRSLVNNLALSSGPQAEVDVNRLLPGEDIENMSPHKIWQTTNKGNNASPALRFSNIPSNANELLMVYDRFASLADDYTGIPAYAYGNDKTAGAGRTSSGLSMLMSAAAKGIKRVLMDVEKNIIRGVIRRQFEWNKQYLGDEFKGDVEVVPTGVVAVMMREQMSQRRMEFLQATANDTDMKIVGMMNRAAVLRETAATLEIPGEDLTRSDEELRDIEEREEKQQGQAQQEQQKTEQAKQQAAQADGQLKQADAQLKQAQAQSIMAQVQNDAQKLQLEMMRLQLDQAKAEAEAEAKGVDFSLKTADLEIKGEKVAAEAVKDRAVAAEIGVRSLEALNGSGDEDPKKDNSGA